MKRIKYEFILTKPTYKKESMPLIFTSRGFFRKYKLSRRYYPYTEVR